MNYKAAVFDLDGTLVNSLDDLADSANATLRAHSFPVHEVEVYRYFVGNGSRKLIERILPEEYAADMAFVEQFMSDYKDCYAQNLLQKTKPYDGIMEMLAELRRRRSRTIHFGKSSAIRKDCRVSPIRKRYFAS